MLLSTPQPRLAVTLVSPTGPHPLLTKLLPLHCLFWLGVSCPSALRFWLVRVLCRVVPSRLVTGRPFPLRPRVSVVVRCLMSWMWAASRLGAIHLPVIQ